MEILNKLIVNFVKVLPKPVVYIFAKKYIAGISLQDAVNAVKELNKKGVYATVDVLGEAISTRKEAETAKNECLEVLDAIQKNNLKANISVKPTQLGLVIDKDLYFSNIKEILNRAKEYNNFVRIDMEDSSLTTTTIETFKELQKEYDNVGIVVQAYLFRTYEDVASLNKSGTNYRLCKGIYIEPAEIAFKEKQAVRDNYVKILDKMLTDGNYVGIATHDKQLLDSAYKLIKDKNIDKSKYEFQMLYGVTEHLREKVNADGHKIRVYVPFGEHWYAYSIRRLQENPEVAWYITKSVFSFK